MKLTMKDLNKLLVFHKRCAEEPSSKFIETTDLEPFNPPSIEALISQILKMQEALRECIDKGHIVADSLQCLTDHVSVLDWLEVENKAKAALLPKE